MGLSSSNLGLVSAPLALLGMAAVGALGGCLGPEPNLDPEASGGAGTTSSSATTSVGPGSSGSSGSSKASSAVGTSSAQSGSGGEGGFVDVGTGSGGAGGAGGGPQCDDPLGDDPNNCGACGRPCSNEGVEGDRICVLGECKPLCKPYRFDLNPQQDPGEPDDGCETIAKRVFVTDARFAAGGNDLENGALGRDLLCQQAAIAAGLGVGSVWKAWVSELNDEAEARLDQATVPYVMLDNRVVANDWDDLTDGALHMPISVTEKGTDLLEPNNTPVPTMRLVWTGTLGDGKASDARCLEWTTASTEEFGDVGLVMTDEEAANNDPEAWTAFASRTCNNLARLYCFEQ